MSATPADLLDAPPAPAPGTTLLGGDRSSWQPRLVLLLLGLDVLLLTLVTTLAVLVRFGQDAVVRGMPYAWVAVGISLLWLAGLARCGCYAPRSVLTRGASLVRVLKATTEVFAVVSLVSFLTQASVSRSYVLLVFPVGLLSLLVSRVLADRVLDRARRTGGAQHRVLVVGDGAELRSLTTTITRDTRHGHQVVATCRPDGSALVLGGVPAQPEGGEPAAVARGLAAAVRQSRADTVAVTEGVAADGEVLRQLCYALEGLGVDILVSPGFTDVAGTRISVRPVAGLPLLHLDEPELTGVHKIVKGGFDRLAAGLGLLLVLPVLIAVFLAVRLTSKGPVIFKQVRVGRDGELFRVWKFRSMVADAEVQFAQVRALNEHTGPLFKIKGDPRITPVGRFLRKWSLDELPQLVNVVKGDMSLVGPRPPLPAEVANYDGYAHRRLLVKPGITGLWQVSGRADLQWDEAVRLDLAYVEGWSLGFDVAILLRTVLAVVKGSGAY